jgi:predicted secreted protein
MSDNKYSTTDFYTTAVLISQNFEVTEITREGPSQKVKRFHFNDTPELRDVIKKYVNGQLMGDLRNFKNSIECVKDMVHSA